VNSPEVTLGSMYGLGNSANLDTWFRCSGSVSDVDKTLRMVCVTFRPLSENGLKMKSLLPSLPILPARER
jgi:hypothetical protein